MAEYTDREHYVPLRQMDLVDLLCKELGDSEAGQRFRQLDQLLSATFHFEYCRLLHELKCEYAPFDPDAATKAMHAYSDAERAAKMDAFYQRFLYLMERANFKRLSLDEIKELAKGVSDWGINMDVDFSIFDRLEVFIRGDLLGTRTIRRWYRFFGEEEVQVPTYKRLVLFVKMKPSKRMPEGVDTNTLFLKLFKDIPKMDMEMLLPGAAMRMPPFQRLKLGSSLVGSGAWILYTIFGQAAQLLTQGSYRAIMGLAMGPLAALLGYGYKQWYGYQTTRTAFSLRLTQSLYYQTLGTNFSVLFHLLDEAEEQECREALLAYYYLWQYAGITGWTMAQLDDRIEQELERLTGLKVDFEIGDALAKLERLKLVTRFGENYAAVPIDRALAALDHAWDNYFKYHVPASDDRQTVKLHAA